jgi:hypothetical protein
VLGVAGWCAVAAVCTILLPFASLSFLHSTFRLHQLAGCVFRNKINIL